MKGYNKLIIGWTLGMSCLASGIIVGKNCSDVERAPLNIQLFKEESKRCLLQRIKPVYPKEVVESLVKSARTPEEAFNITYVLLKFPNDNKRLKSELKFCNGLGFYSLLESLSIGGGVCRDGAIAFCAMLSDNPQYNSRIIGLYNPKANSSHHAISVFEENKKYGYASFNDDTTNLGSVFQKAKYDSIEELLGTEFNVFKEYAYLIIKPEDLKFGRAIIDVEQEEKNEIKEVITFKTFKEKYQQEQSQIKKEKQIIKKLTMEKNE
ncbi:MAG: hypothetical protein KKF52_02375 [Nanoarchaeota archaeon]|nr:hypothetical protein [Nanoarchaeota archaeon]MBU4351906.1 hypothetical protein [Nanoarchaeota archaeon]